MTHELDKRVSAGPMPCRPLIQFGPEQAKRLVESLLKIAEKRRCNLLAHRFRRNGPVSKIGHDLTKLGPRSIPNAVRFRVQFAKQSLSID